MKATVLSLALGLCLTAARAEDITTPSGTTYKNIKVTRVENESIRITHTEGIALIDFDDLPPAMQAQYGWTPEKSAARKAAREAEAKRIAEEERMLEEEPKRKAAEAAAAKKAEEERIAAEERARRKMENAEFEKESATAQKDLIAEAARVRAELDAERERAKRKARGEPEPEPVAAVVPDSSTAATQKPNVVLPPFSTVSSVLAEESMWTKHKNLWIGVGIAVLVVIILFLIPSGGAKKARRR